MDGNKIPNFWLKKETEGVFTSPASSHKGSVLERMKPTVGQVLRAELSVNDEVLSMFVAEAVLSSFKTSNPQ